jgi:ribosome maturation factor RimP
MGYEFVDLKFAKIGRDWRLQVFADKEGEITLKDCEIISRELGYELDRHPEILRQTYTLEVSSPGLDRILKTEQDFKKFANSDFKMKLYEPVQGSRAWKGKIVKAENGNLDFKDEQGNKRTVPIDNIAKANLIVRI